MFSLNVLRSRMECKGRGRERRRTCDKETKTQWGGESPELTRTSDVTLSAYISKQALRQLSFLMPMHVIYCRVADFPTSWAR